MFCGDYASGGQWTIFLVHCVYKVLNLMCFLQNGVRITLNAMSLKYQSKRKCKRSASQKYLLDYMIFSLFLLSKTGTTNSSHSTIAHSWINLIVAIFWQIKLGEDL